MVRIAFGTMGVTMLTMTRKLALRVAVQTKVELG